VLLTLVTLLCPAAAQALPAPFQWQLVEPPSLDLGPRISIAVGELEGYRADEIRAAIVAALLDEERGPVRFVDDPAGEPGGIVLTGTLPELESHDEIEDISVERDKGPITITETDHVLTRTVTIRFDMKAIDVDTGELRGQKHFDIQMAHKGRQKKSPEKAMENARRPEDMASELIRPFGLRIANAVAPRWQVEGFEIERNKTTKVGVLMGKQEDDWDGARQWFVDAAADQPGEEFLHYNAAVLLALDGQFDAADESLARARALKERRRYRMFAGRLSKLRARAEVLAGMGY
jgi:hypothetical protein